jgi:hypothetical protein
MMEEQMKKLLLVAGGIVVAALIAAGSFWGGMQYQITQVDRVRSAFENARGPLANGQNSDQTRAFPGAGGQAGQMPGFAGRGGANGVVKTVDGDVITISTAQDVTTVKLADTTRIQKTIRGTAGDLQPGMRVMVTGEADGDGVITATQVSILNEDAPVFPDPAAAGTEP